MLHSIAERLRQKHRTVPYPNGDPVLPERFRGRPSISANRCAAGYTDDTGISQRVAEDALHHCAGSPQASPDQKADDGTRHTDVPEYRLLLRRNHDIPEKRQPGGLR